MGWVLGHSTPSVRESWRTKLLGFVLPLPYSCLNSPACSPPTPIQAVVRELAASILAWELRMGNTRPCKLSLLSPASPSPPRPHSRAHSALQIPSPTPGTYLLRGGATEKPTGLKFSSPLSCDQDSRRERPVCVLSSPGPCTPHQVAASRRRRGSGQAGIPVVPGPTVGMGALRARPAARQSSTGVLPRLPPAGRPRNVQLPPPPPFRHAGRGGRPSPPAPRGRRHLLRDSAGRRAQHSAWRAAGAAGRSGPWRPRQDDR